MIAVKKIAHENMTIARIFLAVCTFLMIGIRMVLDPIMGDSIYAAVAIVAVLYLIPPLLMPWVDLTVDAVQSNYQLMVWSATMWGFVAGSLIIRGMAVLKVWWLVRGARVL